MSDTKRQMQEFIINNRYTVDNPITRFFTKFVGDRTEDPDICLSEKNEVYAQTCGIRDNTRLKLIFTNGLYTYGMNEFFICVPSQWPVRLYDRTDYYRPDTFPVDVLRKLTVLLEQKKSAFKVSHGLYIDRNSAPWNLLGFPDAVSGLVFIDYVIDGVVTKRRSKNDVTIYGIMPVYRNSAAGDALIDTLTNAKWKDAALPFNKLITINDNMNKAVHKYNIAKIRAAIERGADVNGAFFKESAFGYYSDSCYLEWILWNKDFELIRYMIEKGAELPRDALAIVASWGDKKVFEYLLARGASISRRDNVGMNALSRAKAFENTQGYKDLKELAEKNKK